MPKKSVLGWTDVADKVILSHVDDSKGPASPYIQGSDQLYHHLKSILQPTFEDPVKYSHLSVKQIRNRVGHVFTTYRKQSTKSRGSFWRYGLSVMAPEKLLELYTASELMARGVATRERTTERRNSSPAQLVAAAAQELRNGVTLTQHKTASAPVPRRQQAISPKPDAGYRGPTSAPADGAIIIRSQSSSRKRKYEAHVNDHEDAEDDSDPLPPMRKSARLGQTLEIGSRRALHSSNDYEPVPQQGKRRHQTPGTSISRSHSNSQAPSVVAGEGQSQKPRGRGSTVMAEPSENAPQLKLGQEEPYHQEEMNSNTTGKGLNAELEMTGTPSRRGKRRLKEPDGNEEDEDAPRLKSSKSNDGSRLLRPHTVSATSDNEDTEPALQAVNMRTKVDTSAMDRDPSRVAIVRDKLPIVPPSSKLALDVQADSSTAELVQGLDMQGNSCQPSLLIDELEDGTLDKQEVQLLEDRVRLPQPLEPHAIRGTMDRISTLIKTSVDRVLRALRVPEHHPVYIDPELHYPKDFLRLLSTLVGCDINFVQSDAQDFFSSQTQRHVNLYVFLQALLGAAVRDWCFKSCPQGDDFWTKHKWLLNSVEMYFGPFAAQRVKHHHLQQYIIDTVEPHIEKKAETMARRFDPLLQFLLPEPATFHKDALVDNVESYRPVDAKHCAVWHQEWTQSLRVVFTTALRWRAQAEKNGNGEFEFRFPNRGQAFQSSSQDSNEYEDHVLLALMPTVRMKVKQRLDRDSIEDGWYEVYNGVVYADRSMGEQPQGYDILAAA